MSLEYAKFIFTVTFILSLAAAAYVYNEFLPVSILFYRDVVLFFIVRLFVWHGVNGLHLAKLSEFNIQPFTETTRRKWEQPET